VFVVGGPLSDDSLLRLIDRLGARVAGLESCTSPDRWEALGTSLSEDSFVHLARTVLEQAVCPRRSTVDRREHLTRRLDETQPSSIIYARQSFCDPGAYDALEVSRLATERGLPFLELEVGFPFEASGPLRTRVEAFLEAQTLDDDLLDDLLDDDLIDDDLFDDPPDDDLFDDDLIGQEG
jgi:benzoyl-CoA reductase/2-hydroxyglutaryl-CoA dehydratase subunit BcrC/BadD/HgdB